MRSGWSRGHIGAESLEAVMLDCNGDRPAFRCLRDDEVAAILEP